eukprot:TRINITY_DN52888_c0_g1_i1.p1 TRINITY_DN52888_c0_g1~~TRINITY_DN52888_c0_g1_i1.p1  ORF type:complete len:678 (-),score=137.97 TRINITY_DN52888_c0_g1_i1:58-1851(-)
MAGLVKLLNLVAPNDILLDGQTWGGFSFLVGFLVVFRTSQAYARFWEGATSLSRMRAEWIDACSAVVAFTHHCKADIETITKFRHQLVRLFSILHAMALGELEHEGGPGERPRAFEFELLDAVGMDQTSLESLTMCDRKVSLVFQWIESYIVHNLKSGFLSIPPPILSRVFQEMSNGMVAFHDAQKIAELPFPFPYAQACDCLLVIHYCLVPFITSQYTAGPISAMMFSFIQVVIMWSLVNIAIEIEHPFGEDANDLPAQEMQEQLNRELLLLVHPNANRLPRVSQDNILSRAFMKEWGSDPKEEEPDMFLSFRAVVELKLQSRFSCFDDLGERDEQLSWKDSVTRNFMKEHSVAACAPPAAVYGQATEQLGSTIIFDSGPAKFEKVYEATGHSSGYLETAADDPLPLLAGSSTAAAAEEPHIAIKVASAEADLAEINRQMQPLFEERMPAKVQYADIAATCQPSSLVLGAKSTGPLSQDTSGDTCGGGSTSSSTSMSSRPPQGGFAIVGQDRDGQPSRSVTAVSQGAAGGAEGGARQSCVCAAPSARGSVMFPPRQVQVVVPTAVPSKDNDTHEEYNDTLDGNAILARPGSCQCLQ